MTVSKSFVTVLTNLASLFLFSFFIIYFLKPIETEDVWWHLATGKYIAQHGVPHEDPFPFLQEKTPWVLTSWLGSLTLFGVFQIGGMVGLKVFRILLALITLAFFFRYAYRKIPQAALIFLIFLMSFGLEGRAFLRPDIFNYLFLQILLILLLKYEAKRDRRYLYALPFLGAVWSNVHLGSFVYGGITIFLFVFAPVMQLLGEKFSRRRASRQEAATLTQAKEVGVCLLLYFAAFCISPYGFKNFLYPWGVFFMPQFIDLPNSMATVLEVQPPVSLFLGLSGFWFFVLAAAGVIVLIGNQQRKSFLVWLFIISLFMFLYAARTGAFFVVVAGYVIVENLSDLLKNKKYARWQTPALEAAFCLILIFLAGVNTVRAFNDKVFVDGQWQRTAFLTEDVFAPDGAVRFLRENGIQGKVFNADRYGGYLLWHSYPSLRPFIDGRRINRREWDVFRPAVLWPERYWKKAEEEFGFNIVLLGDYSSFYAKLLEHLRHDPSWQLIGVDGYSIVLIKRGKLSIPRELESYAKKLQKTKVDPRKVNEAVNRPLPPESLLSQLTGYLFPPSDFIDTFEESIALYDMGFRQAGLAGVLKTLEISDSKEGRNVLRLMQQSQRNSP